MADIPEEPQHNKLKYYHIAETMPNYLKFAMGGLAGMGATCFVHPVDLLKNRIQLSPPGISTGAIIKGILDKEGFFAFYGGLSASLLRQATYSTARLGCFNYLIESFTQEDGTPPGFAAKASFGMLAGLIGAFIGTPADVALIRMSADGRLPPNERRNYTNVFNALGRMAKEEGIGALWRGAVTTMGRAMVVNAAQLASYSQAKELLVNMFSMKEGIPLHFGSAMISGLITTTASMPVDIAKTKIQNMKIIDGKPEFAGAGDVIKKIIKSEGVMALWKGFIPYYARVGPHTILTFIFLEQMNQAYFKWAAK